MKASLFIKLAAVATCDTVIQNNSVRVILSSYSISLSLGRVSLIEELLSQFVVAPLPVHQFLVSPSLLNSALTDHNDLICPLNGLQPVSDHQQGLVGTTSQGLLNLCRVSDRNIYYFIIISSFFSESKAKKLFKETVHPKMLLHSLSTPPMPMENFPFSFEFLSPDFPSAWG